MSITISLYCALRCQATTQRILQRETLIAWWISKSMKLRPQFLTFVSLFMCANKHVDCMLTSCRRLSSCLGMQLMRSVRISGVSSGFRSISVVDKTYLKFNYFCVLSIALYEG